MTEPSRIAEEVRALEGLDLEGLRAEWQLRYGLPPKLRSPQLLRLVLAWRIQVEVSGGLDAATRRRLRTGVSLGRTDHIRSGARIMREWRGRIYEIDRTPEGYGWEGEMYSSLSSLARAITGVKRNGPKFFGLRDGDAR